MPFLPKLPRPPPNPSTPSTLRRRAVLAPVLLHRCGVALHPAFPRRQSKGGQSSGPPRGRGATQTHSVGAPNTDGGANQHVEARPWSTTEGGAYEQVSAAAGIDRMEQGKAAVVGQRWGRVGQPPGRLRCSPPPRGALTCATPLAGRGEWGWHRSRRSGSIAHHRGSPGRHNPHSRPLL